MNLTCVSTPYLLVVLDDHLVPGDVAAGHGQRAEREDGQRLEPAAGVLAVRQEGEAPLVRVRPRHVAVAGAEGRPAVHADLVHGAVGQAQGQRELEAERPAVHHRRLGGGGIHLVDDGVVGVQNGDVGRTVGLPDLFRPRKKC